MHPERLDNTVLFNAIQRSHGETFNVMLTVEIILVLKNMRLEVRLAYQERNVRHIIQMPEIFKVRQRVQQRNGRQQLSAMSRKLSRHCLSSSLQQDKNWRIYINQKLQLFPTNRACSIILIGNAVHLPLHRKPLDRPRQQELPHSRAAPRSTKYSNRKHVLRCTYDVKRRQS